MGILLHIWAQCAFLAAMDALNLHDMSRVYIVHACILQVIDIQYDAKLCDVQHSICSACIEVRGGF